MTKTRKITECAILVALAAALSFLKIPLGPNGGSIDFVMIPLLVLALRHGAGWGIMSGAAFGLVKCLISGGFAWGIVSVLLDYVLAYAVVGCAGFFRNLKGGAAIGSVVSGLLRFLVHFISGVTIWKILEPVNLYGMDFGVNSSGIILYSIVYNGAFMLPNIIIATVAVVLLKKYLPQIVKAS